MRVSLSWLGVFLISVFLLYFIIYGYNVYETFQNHKDSLEGFRVQEYTSDLQITRCPAGSESFINDKGITLCCEGSVMNGKCDANSFCSLSESIDSLPNCTQWVEAYLEEKGAKRCPASLPKYYESADKKVRGCTSGNRKKDGSDILNKDQKFCRLYSKKTDDESKVDSCTNIKLLEKAQCFKSLGAQSNKSLQNYGNTPALVQCRLQNKISYPNSCFTDETLVRYFEHSMPGKGASILNSYKQDPSMSSFICSSFDQDVKSGVISLTDPSPQQIANTTGVERKKILRKKYEKICKTL